MNNVYVIYNEYEDSFRALNGIQDNIDIEKVFVDKNQAIEYIKKEVCLENDEWSFKAHGDKDIFYVEIFYDEEWQYTIYCKEMRVE